MYTLHAGSTAADVEARTNDPTLFPAKMSDKLLKNFPGVVIQTVEFDAFMRETKKFADRLRKFNLLKEFTILPGAIHGLGGSVKGDWVKEEYNAYYPMWIECYLRRDDGVKK